MNSRRFIALTPNPRIMGSIAGRACIAAKADLSCPLWVVCHERRPEYRGAQLYER